jgi:hypothetical protein
MFRSPFFEGLAIDRAVLREADLIHKSAND